MLLSQKQQQRQSQSLVMTPQLAQSIRLLHLSHGELMAFVRDEVEKNPLLEMDSTESGTDAGGLTPDAAGGGDTRDGVEAGPIENTADRMRADDMQSGGQLDTSFENVFESEPAARPESGGREQDRGRAGASATTHPQGSDSDYDLIANTGEDVSLVEHLMRQVAFTFHGEQERKIAGYIAHGLNEDGYFKEPIEEAATRNGVSAEVFEAVLTRFQTLDPSGIGARTLAECLEIQLTERNRFDPAMQVLINHLDLLARREFSKLMKKCGVDQADFADMIEEVRLLNPRPAWAHESVPCETVVPDVIVSTTSVGDWRIELNPETLPRVLVDREYHLELSSALADTDGEAFINDCLQNANWLVRSLDQRAQTILKVAREIVKQQDLFFAEGKQHLKPLTLKDVATAIKMHESTVSRVTSNKYLSCAHGTYELKHFFSSALSAGKGEDLVSAEAVKYRIKKLIDAEAENDVLSDERIAQNLQEAGIEIARRTVAKYREAMRIASSSQRRREKARGL